MEPDKIDGYNVRVCFEAAFEKNDWNGVSCLFGRFRAVLDGRCLVKVEFNSAEIESAEEALYEVMLHGINIGDCTRITRKCGDGELVIGIPYPLANREMLWYAKKALWLCLSESTELRDREAKEKEQA